MYVSLFYNCKYLHSKRRAITTLEICQKKNGFRETVLLVYLIKTDRDLLHECGFDIRDIDRLCLELKNILLDHNKEYVDHIKNQEESNIEKCLG